MRLQKHTCGLTNSLLFILILLSYNVASIKLVNAIEYSTTVGQPITFSTRDFSSGTPDSCSWNFGDGTTSSDQNPTHIYYSAGTKTVILIVYLTMSYTDPLTGRTLTRPISISYSANVNVTGSPPPGPDLMLFLGIGAAIIVIAAIVFLMLRKPKKSSPPTIKTTVDPTEIPADGKSESTITLELVNENGETIESSTDLNFNITSTKGKLSIKNGSLTLKKGEKQGKFTITSPTTLGEDTIIIKPEGLNQVTKTIKYTEKKRFCMHCGKDMKVEDKACPRCGNTPISGTDTKECENCHKTIPKLAKYCSECGAKQPEEKN